MSPFVTVGLVVGVLGLFYVWWFWKSAQLAQRNEVAPTIGMAPGESGVHRWEGERYFGPLVPGTNRRAAEWAKLVLRNVFSDPRLNAWRNIRHRGAPLELVLTDAGRLVVNVAVGWRDQHRPRAVLDGRQVTQGYEPLGAWGRDDRPEVLLARDVFAGRSPGRWVAPDRQELDRGVMTLAVIRSRDGRQLLAWMPDEAFRLLVEWAVTTLVPDEILGAQDPSVWTPGAPPADESDEPAPAADDPQPARLLAQADAIEAVMREVGYWDLGPLREGAMDFTRGFAADTMAIEQWVQHVLVPRIRELAATGEPFPASSSVAARYLREHDGDDPDGPWTKVHAELKKLDRLINHPDE